MVVRHNADGTHSLLYAGADLIFHLPHLGVAEAAGDVSAAPTGYTLFGMTGNAAPVVPHPEVEALLGRLMPDGDGDIALVTCRGFPDADHDHLYAARSGKVFHITRGPSPRR